MVIETKKEVKLSNTWKPIKPTNPNQNPDKQWGRPSKLEKFLEAMEEVLNEWLQSIIMTDEELFILANENLEEDEQIWHSTFKEYKASSLKEETDWHKRFQDLYKKALVKQKNNLFNSLSSDNPQWQKYAWIIERKFSEWNLKTISENTNKNATVNYTKEEWESMTDEELLALSELG